MVTLNFKQTGFRNHHVHSDIVFRLSPKEVELFPSPAAGVRVLLPCSSFPPPPLVTIVKFIHVQNGDSRCKVGSVL